MDLITKFRAFQLDSAGSLFSFYKNNHYTLIEARMPKGGIGVLQTDLRLHDKEHVDLLHITSWDTDHCCFDDLKNILNNFRPKRIEIPSYKPESNEGILCKKILTDYDHIHQRFVHNVTVVNENYISNLTYALKNNPTDVVYHPKYNCDKKNDMSLIRLFRSNGFNVASLGDCECSEIADRLCSCVVFNSEIDVLILPHHGADNGFITDKFLKQTRPIIAICSSNYDNHYEHPRQEIRDLLYFNGINLYTTKTGDVIIYQVQNSNKAILINYLGSNTQTGQQISFTPKRFN